MISVVITAYNASQYIGEVLDSVLNQTRLPEEIIIVDDGSKDETLKKVKEYPKKLKGKKKKTLSKIKKYKVISQKNKGPAGASNTAIKDAKGDIIISVDSDAVLDKRFIEKAVQELKKNKDMGAVAGYIGTANPQKFWARMMGYDLEYRYDHIGELGKKKVYVDHVSPNNTAYKKEVFEKVGTFNEGYHYAQDIEFSYRMIKKGYKIGLMKDVGCKHYWRETFKAYTKQQFNVSYWRLRFIGKNPSKTKGDKVAGMRMLMQAPWTGLTILLFLGAFWYNIWYMPAVMLGLLLIERYQEAIYLLRKKRSWSMLLMPFVHLWRNIVWGYSIAYFVIRH